MMGRFNVHFLASLAQSTPSRLHGNTPLVLIVGLARSFMRSSSLSHQAGGCVSGGRQHPRFIYSLTHTNSQAAAAAAGSARSSSSRGGAAAAAAAAGSSSGSSGQRQSKISGCFDIYLRFGTLPRLSAHETLASAHIPLSGYSISCDDL